MKNLPSGIQILGSFWLLGGSLGLVKLAVHKKSGRYEMRRNHRRWGLWWARL